jgi:hypothetical protein
VIAIPKAVPAAGGCSVSITTIIKTETPTASEYMTIVLKNEECEIKDNSDPEISPTRWPPITFLSLAVIFLGITNTINVVAPIDAIIAAFCKLNNRSTINIVRVAKKL